MRKASWLSPYLALMFAANVAAQVPSINPGGIVDGASFTAGAPVAPGSIISIFGRNLATGIGNAGSIPLPNNLGGASVRVNGVLAPLYYASPGQINAQLAFETSTGPASVVVTVGSSTSAATTVNVASSAGKALLRRTSRSRP